MIEVKISYQGTVLMAILVNMDIGDVNGIKEQTNIKVLSILPEASENITTKYAMINNIVIGIIAVLISSSLDTVEPIAPYKNA